MNQLAAFSWGTWFDANSDGTPHTFSRPSRSQSWTPDDQGNFTTVTTNGTGYFLSRSGVPPLGLIWPGIGHWPSRTVFPGSREVTREPIVKAKRRDAASTEDQIATISRPSRFQSLTPDGQGIFTTVATNGTGETRTYDKQNQVTAVGGVTLTYDAAGNLKTDEQNRTFVYDAWNGLISVSVPNNPNSFQAVYTIDPLGRPITETSGGVTRDLYYSKDWQVIEERVGSVAKAQFVWSPIYVDAMIERDRDADNNPANGLEQRLWPLHDANFNTTALVDNGGTVTERYVYDPYGKVTVLAADGTTVRTNSSVDWVYLHQGGRLDTATGLYNFRNRDYSPTLMRWTTNDPIGFGGGDTNTYRYVGNGPTGTLDPSGLAAFQDDGTGSSASNSQQSTPNKNAIYDAYRQSAHNMARYGRQYGVNVNLQERLYQIEIQRFWGKLDWTPGKPKQEDELDRQLKQGAFGLEIYGGGDQSSAGQALGASAYTVRYTLPAHLAEKGVDLAIDRVSNPIVERFASLLWKATKGVYRIVKGKLHKIVMRGGKEVAEQASAAEVQAIKNRFEEYARNAGGPAAPSVNPKTRLPRTKGQWVEGTPGNGAWKSDLPEVNAITGNKPIQFVDGRPVFTPWSKGQIKFKPGQLDGSQADFNAVYDYIAKQKGCLVETLLRTICGMLVSLLTTWIAPQFS